MLKTEGRYIVNEQGDKVVLRGYNVGNWMMMENFMLGYSGTESEFRRAIKKYAGEENCEYFFDKYYEYFLNEKDILFMKEMGLNCIRVPFNYRCFEDDNLPYQYNEKALLRMDNLIDICKKNNMYVILDMHAVQGYQSVCWHCDNNGQPTRFYTNADERKRYYRLWQYLAEHYRGENIIAGYDVVNEPEALPEEEKMLNQIYREVVENIREKDPDHIIFLAGNVYDKKFDSLEAPFADNLAYTCHYYLTACTSTPIHYPGEVENIDYNCQLIECQMDNLDGFMRKYNVPCWVGEFGVRLNYPGFTEDRLRIFNDQLACICRREHHYSIWSYKDIGFLSTVTVKKDSPWMKFAEDIIRIKEKYYLDQNFKLNEDWGITQLLDLRAKDGFDDRYGKLKNKVVASMKHVLSTELADRLGRKFSGLSKKELDCLAASFDFDNCMVDERRVDGIKKYGF